MTPHGRPPALPGLPKPARMSAPKDGGASYAEAARRGQAVSAAGADGDLVDPRRRRRTGFAPPSSPSASSRDASPRVRPSPSPSSRVASRLHGSSSRHTSSPSSPSHPSSLPPRALKKKKRFGLVLIFEGRECVEALSPDEADGRKVILWSQGDDLPSCEVVRETLCALLGGAESISRVRHYGVAPCRRVEIICSSTEARDLVLGLVRSDANTQTRLNVKSVRAGRNGRNGEMRCASLPSQPRGLPLPLPGLGVGFPSGTRLSAWGNSGGLGD